MRVALYARVSTVEQNAEMQLIEMREYCKHRGFVICAEYVDVGISGSKEKRPELDRLMKDAMRRKCDAVMIWKLDRFARSLRHLLNAFAEFEALGIAFISIRDNLDLTTPAGRLVFQIVGAMTEFERDLIRERVRAGMRRAKAKGHRLGRPKTQLDIALVSKLKAEGVSVRSIARQVNSSIGTIYRQLPV